MARPLHVPIVSCLLAWSAPDMPIPLEPRGCICFMICCQNLLRTFPWNYVFLGVFTVSMGILVFDLR